ncbi:MAG: zinc-binding dehydrogenase [Acidimicrobiia bacterium]
MSMLAAVYHGRRDLRIDRVEVPVPGPGEVLLEVHSAGICGTDASEWANGPMMLPIQTRNPHSGHLGPLTMGHEFGGRVVAQGVGVSGFPEGSLVACGAGISCSDCDQCRQGLTNFCVNYHTLGLQLDGGIAQYVVAPASICLPVDHLGLTDDGAAIVQPMAIALHSMRQGTPERGEPAIVLGIGGIGAFLVHALSTFGAEVVAIDLDRSRLDIARSLGAKHTIEVDSTLDLAALIRNEVDGTIGLIYEVTGAPAVAAAAIEVLAPRGRLVLIGLSGAKIEVDTRSVTLRELRLLGTNAHVFAADFPDAAELISLGESRWGAVAPSALPLSGLVEHGIEPLVARESPSIKTLIDPHTAEIRTTSFRRASEEDSISARALSGPETNI